MAGFYWLCLKRAFRPAWDRLNTVSLAVGVGIGLAVWRLPAFNDA